MTIPEILQLKVGTNFAQRLLLANETQSQHCGPMGCLAIMVDNENPFDDSDIEDALFPWTLASRCRTETVNSFG